MPFEMLVPRPGERARPHCVYVLQSGSTVWQHSVALTGVFRNGLECKMQTGTQWFGLI